MDQDTPVRLDVHLESVEIDLEYEILIFTRNLAYEILNFTRKWNNFTGLGPGVSCSWEGRLG